jgi:hypothetical protein
MKSKIADCPTVLYDLHHKGNLNSDIVMTNFIVYMSSGYAFLPYNQLHQC